MNFGVISNKSTDPKGILHELICSKIRNRGCKLVFDIEMEKYEDLNVDHLNDTDIIISMGGDGTFLNIARQTAKYKIPIMGVNTGSLGFLSATDINDIDSALDNILKKDFTIDERMMVTANIIRANEKFGPFNALNDLVIARGLLTRIVTLKVFIDDIYVDSFPGDGMIVSTPTGSTGYSLSAGGPVIDHGLDLMLITPICPHIMHAKSFIASPDSTIKIEVLEEGSYSCYLTADGQMGHELKGGDTIEITKSVLGVKVIKFSGSALFNTLRNKIYYRNGKENEA